MVSSIGNSGVDTDTVNTSNLIVTGKNNFPDQINVFYYTSSTADYPLGTKLQQNTATYRYGYVTTVAESSNLGVSDTGRDFTAAITAVDDEKSLISGTFTMLNGSGATLAENDPRIIDGSLNMNDGPSWGYTFVISGNTAAANGDPITFTYTNNAEGTHNVQIGNSATFTTNQYVVRNATNDASNVTQTPIGAYRAHADPGNKFMWLQTSGVGELKGNASGIAKGAEVAIAGSGASAARIDTRTKYNEQLVGRALRSTSGADEYLPVQLFLEY